MKHPPWSDCEKCPLDELNSYCPSVGPEEADIVIIGEAPGQNEAAKGIPFIGASGQLLNMLLNHNGIERSDVFITNTVLCRPEGNANPPASAIKACGARLHREVTDRSPGTIVALGNFASKRILHTDEGITSLRAGPPKTSADYPGVRIIPTFHPAATLYNSGAFPDLASDFQKIKRPDVATTWEPPEYTVYDSELGAGSFLEWLLRQDAPVVIDIEAGIEKDIDFDHPERYQMLAVGFAWSAKDAAVIGENALQFPFIRNLIGKVVETQKVICHNGKFDLAGLEQWGSGTLYFDTMLAGYCLDERRGIHSLEYNSIERLGSPSWKYEVGSYLGPNKNYASIPRDILYRYNAFDISNTYRLYELYVEELKAKDLRALHDFLVEASDTLRFVEQNGIHVNEAYLDELTLHYDKELAATKSRLQQLVEISDYNPNSPLQVMNALKSQWPPLTRRVKNTQAETIEKLRLRAFQVGNNTLFDFCNLHLQFKKDSKSYGTYVKGTRKRLYEGKVHSTFKLHGTVSGRLSSVNPNLQNVTRGSNLRRLFIPGDETKILGQADYGQAEFRVLATLAQDEYLRGVFNDPDRSIHVETAKKFYGEDFDKVRDKENYIRAKAVVFGLLYGREAFSLAAEFGMSTEEAQGYIDRFLGVIPETMEYIQNEVIERVLEGGDLVSPFGRHRRFWLITKQNKHSILKEARAFMPQSTASDINLSAGIELSRSGMRDMLRIPVHDAWVFECDRGDEDEIGRHVSEVMSRVAQEKLGDYVPFPVDVEFGNSWGELE